jgi:uncharacterized phage protein (TIGR02218 family)
MKTIPAAIQTALDSGSMALATCVRIETKGNVVYGFTDWQTDLIVSAVTYQSIGGYTAEAIKTTSELNVDNVDLVGYFDAAGLTLDDIRNGALDNAAIEKFKVNPRAPADGIIKLRAGTLGRMQTGDADYSLEVRGLLQRLQQTQGKVLTPRCRADLFDAQCQVPGNPPNWTASLATTVVLAGDAGSGTTVKPTTPNGFYYQCSVAGTTNDTEGEPVWDTVLGGTTVEADGVEWLTIAAKTMPGILTGSTSRAVFQDSARTEADGFFDHGLVTLWTGGNAGVAREIKNYTVAAGEIEVFLPFDYDIAGIEVYSIAAGCAKRIIDCRDKFNNMINRRAEDYVPGTDKANEVPQAR